MAIVTRGGVAFTNLDGQPVVKRAQRITWDPVQAEKAGYKHFMLKEIFEQPTAVRETILGRVSQDTGLVFLDEMGLTDDDLRAIDKVQLLACGTSWHAALVGKFLIEQLAGVPTEVDYGSEFRYRRPIVNERTLTVVITQSGETADTLAALREAKGKGARSLAICNVVGSMATREAEGTLYTHAGPEIGVASTKCFTTQLAALLLLAVYLGRQRGALSKEQGQEILQALWETPSHMREVLGDADYMHVIAKKLTHSKDVLFLGRGLGYPIALEGALKLKEISYAHAEGYAAGEMKHGPIALIDENLPVIVVCPRDAHYDKTLSNMQEVRAREGQVIAIATRGDESVMELAQHMVWLPRVHDDVLPLLTVLPLQLISYYVANLKGNDVDQPRNLAKTVTVE
jgi:glucosamine--fructose-6-phosphate aminotransferase (isomerizing)